MTDYDVIIAGAGTGGATTAYTLAKRGHSVLLIDRKERDNIGNKTCGDALGNHHIEELRELVGIPELFEYFGIFPDLPERLFLNIPGKDWQVPARIDLPHT